MNHEILVVEDDEGIREAIAIYLSHAGFHVIQAENGLKGLEAFRTRKPALAVVDIMMPEMDGFTMVSRIRETSDIPVLFLSAKSEDVDKLHGFTIGADDYLTKPFSSVELVARVKARLRRYEQILELKSGEAAPHGSHQWRAGTGSGDEGSVCQRGPGTSDTQGILDSGAPHATPGTGIFRPADL